jgi:hypothetical protein
MLKMAARGLAAACLLLFSQATWAQSPAIRYDSGRNVFLLEQWAGAAKLPADRRPEVFSVSVDAPDVPALLGRHDFEAGSLTFAPQFPLQPGVRYRAVARLPGMEPVTKIIDIPKPSVNPTTVVSTVYPTTGVLAENHLKFYIHFSAPMSRGFAYDNVLLLDESGGKIEAPFLELGEELWDRDGRRFTLFFDPGRIKRGLVSQQELGVALEQGRRYTLVIGRNWRDAAGNPLAAEHRKSILAGPADRKNVDLKAWSVKKPGAGSGDALIIAFPEPMDHALLNREMDLVDASGTPVPGIIAIGGEERTWVFTPDTAWKKGTYQIVVGAALSDLAGNMVDRPFEIDVFDSIDKQAAGAPHFIPLTIE